MWLEKYMQKFNIKSRYELSRLTGIRESTLSNIIIRKTEPGSTKFDTIRKLAHVAQIDLNDFNEWLLKTEEEINMKTELASLSDVTIYLAEDGNTVYKKYHQNTSLAGKEIEYVLSSDDVDLLKDYAEKYNTTTDADEADDAETYILEQLLV